jgi:peptidoglycan DL-endopeptidase CwlO
MHLWSLPMPTRRTFLKASSLACAASALHPMLHAQNPAIPDPFSNQNLEPGEQGLLTRAAFAAVLQSIFTLSLPDGTTRTLRLVNVSDPTADDPSGQNFSISFTVAGGAFSQGTYPLDHATMGSFALFVVPSSTDSSAQSCTAVFYNVGVQVSPLTGVTQGVGSLLPITTTTTPAPSTFRPAAVAASMSTGTAPAASNTSNAVPSGANEVVLVEGAPSDFSSNMDVLSDSTTSTDSSSCTDSTAKTADGSSTSSSTASTTANTSCATTGTATSTTTTSTTTPQ